ncbi:MAG: FAD-dependent oxidoreductase [Actinomycetota bacterium]|nr:FAD-dependent oxidoreductase [Actinomycetota bacterium]
MHELSNLSLWHATMSADEWGAGRPALDADLDVDVAIVGGGYTGLWTAYYLKQHDPALRVVVLEANVVGFGASGRNGGWCSALLPMGMDSIARSSSREEAMRLQAAMHDTVDEVARVVATEGIECDLQKGGYLGLDRNGAQLQRSREHVAHMQSYGFADADYRVLSAAEAAERCGAANVLGGTYTPHCAAVHPARLARGLARVVERLGVVVHEHTPVVEIAPRRARTHLGTVTARVVVRATEAFTPSLAGLQREVAPVYSLMIATEPLPSGFWQRAGLADRATFNDGRHMIVYGQRTADDRIAFGGRGARYHWGSAMKPQYDRNEKVHELIHRTLLELFPYLGDAAITHRWGGAVAATRDWWCHATFDRATGLASAGGYVGDGVGTTNLSGRTLADLITGTDSDLTSLPWVGHGSRRWEPEPFRFIGINTMVHLPAGADRHEQRHGTPSRWREAIIDRLTGH